MKTALALLFVAICSPILALSWRGDLLPALAQTPDAAPHHCPMHPTIVQDRKGKCPICGMDLVLVTQAKKASSPGAMAIGADKQSVLGVRVSPVQRATSTRALRVLGRVAPDEARVYKLNTGIDGSIRDVSAVTTGSRVKKNQLLATYYAPGALSVIQLYILNLAGQDRVRQRQAEGSVEGEGVGLGNANIQQRTLQLENFGVSALQREEIRRTRAVPDAIEMRAPADGFVLARNVSPGLKFDRGMELYRIADLRRVWIVADVFLHDAQHVRAGMRAQVTVPEQRRTFPATVAAILPQLDPATRTLKIRLAVDNPGYVLRPDMFVDVGLTVSLPSAVVVPADAVVDSGTAKTVFVQSGEGVFEPRHVETGWRSGDQVEIVAGLSPGEQIVTSGTFFLDSESRMRPPPSGAAAANGAPPAPSGREHRSRGGAGHRPQALASAGREEAEHAHAGDAR